MIESIGNVKLNYDFYLGQDSYSDGVIEDELLDYVKKYDNIYDILKIDDRWPILYHLSPVRQNIIEWYPFKATDSILEIGSGCGAITGALCRNAKNVVCNDLSKKRSEINAYRNKSYNNLEIVVGNFNDIKLNKKFNYVTLIGVLEYANYYTNSETPFITFLQNVSKYLEPKGKLLIAIENKFGLKYWNGANEDHTGVIFDGIEGYKNTNSKVRTFSKKELSQMMAKAGFNNINFYYPFPDYKFPNQIFSDDYLPQVDDLVSSLKSYDSSRIFMFDENVVYKEIIMEDKFDFYSNSFFIEAWAE